MKKIALIHLRAHNESGSEPIEILNVLKILAEFQAQVDFFNIVIEEHLSELQTKNYDALILFATPNAVSNSILEKIVLDFYHQSKPIGNLASAALLVARILKKYNPLITIGETSELIPALAKIKIQHELCPSNDYITDRDCKLLSTPGTLNSHSTAADVYSGIKLMTKELMEMA